MTEEEKFIKGLYDEVNEELKEVYKEQKDNRNKLLQMLGMLVISNNVFGEFMKLTSRVIKKESKKIFDLLKGFGNKQAKTQEKVITKILTDTVNKTFKFYSYNADLKDVRKIINDNFKGKHFSKRVWKNEKEVAEYLHKQIDKFLDGKISVNNIKSNMLKIYDNSAYEVRRLVETEVNRCSNDAFYRFCKETGVEKVIYNATLDVRTCPKCAPYDKKTFELDKKIELPRHPLCRCFYEIAE